MRLIVGNKNYSSWSLRAWLPLRHFEIRFDEERIALFQPGYKERILRYSPAGKVPVLIDGSATVWETLAIGEYLAEKYPQHAMWPQDLLLRTHARSISAEMHAGFAALRTHMPMNMRAHHPGKGRTPEVEADIARVCSLWHTCLERSGGPFLFGHFTFADAMYAPVVSRFVTYAVELAGPLDRYVDRISNLAAMQEWRAAALAESDVIAEDEPYR